MIKNLEEISVDLNMGLMFNILEVTSHVGFSLAKPLLFMFFMDVADIFLCRVGKIQEEFIVNESNMFFSLNKKCLF